MQRAKDKATTALCRTQSNIEEDFLCTHRLHWLSPISVQLPSALGGISVNLQHQHVNKRKKSSISHILKWGLNAFILASYDKRGGNSSSMMHNSR